MSKKRVKKFRYVTLQDDYYGFCNGEEVYDGDKLLFDVYNLTDCPEDAIVERSLFSSSNWINAVRLGMELSRQGYDDVALEDATVEKVPS